MSELQSTVEFSVELYKFYNVDLFQRGMYQVRCALRVQSKLGVEVEVAIPDVTTGLGSALVLGNYGACRPFQILYRNEEVNLKDVVLFRCHMLVDGNNLKESLERAEFSIVLELWFSDSSPASMVIVSSRTLQLNFSPIEGLHYHLPILFDYFHLSAISLTVHAVLTALHQPSMKRGILRYMQSCAPKSSKSWSKIRSAPSTTLTDPVLPVSSHKVYARINETPQVHLEAYNVLMDSSNNLKSTIKKYKALFMQREEVIIENYDVLVVKQNNYDSTKFMKNHVSQHSDLAQLCAENIKLWNYFLLTFSCKIAIQQHLSKIHHNLRVRRFAELFFLIYNPRKSAFGGYETNYQNYFVIAEIIRRSKYLQTLPPLPIHCLILDGDSTSMPIIFEDQYQDPFDQNERTFQHLSLQRNYTWNFKTPMFEETGCSCGLENLWEKQKHSQKTLISSDTYKLDEPVCYTIPTRHSKSLDQLQTCSKNIFHYSLNSIFSQKELNGSYEKTRRGSALKNVASEHNMRYRKYFLEELNSHSQCYSEKDSCNCTINSSNYNNFNSLMVGKERKCTELKINSDLTPGKNGVEKKYKQFNIKHLNNIKQHGSSLVKSVSHSAASNGRTSLFKSSSMQFFSPKKSLANGVNKFNSLVTRRSLKNQKKIVNNQKCNGTKSNVDNKDNVKKSKKTKSKRNLANGKMFEIGSTSTSTDSLIFNKLIKTGLKTALPRERNMRRIRSASCLGEEFLPLPLSGTESLPNLSPKADERVHYPELEYYSSTSSTTSEQSGWITSRSSSIASSTDVTNPATSANLSNIENIQKRLFNLTCSDFKRIEKDEEGSYKTNGKKSFKLDGKPSDYGGVCEFALPPPRQFRDLSPSSSVTNGHEEEINAVDNLLYHVIDTETDLDRKESQFRRVTSDESAFSMKPWENESYKAFKRAKHEFKSQLNFPGLLYSDLELPASVPYFHISDEFRIFSPEGMHLVVCVHGLDGNSADLRLVKTYLELGLPGAYLDFLMSERNQGDTFSDFDTMTDRLVGEILHYLDTSTIRPTRISFVGHSLGNVIIRSALTRPQMKFLLPRLHTFLSLSGPHLGTLYNSSGLVNMGMWFMQKWKKSGSLLQLCLKDAIDSRQSFLYRLSQKSTLHHFKNVLLCGSGQDRYVPLHSARIELCKESLKDTSEMGIIYREMVHNILSPIIAQKEVKLVRYDIHHALPNTANALIGRAAHIAVLDSELFIEKFMAVVGVKYFR